MNIVAEYNVVKIEIIKAAGDVFLKYGFNRISMQDISRASGKGRSTLYYYFKNKDEILDGFVMNIFSGMLSKSQNSIQPGNTFIVNIERYYRTKLQIFRKLIKKYHLLIEDLKREPLFIIKKMTFFFDKEVLVIKQIIDGAINQKEIEALSQEDALFLAQTLVTAFQSLVLSMLMFGKFRDFEDKLSWMAQILGKGLK